MDVTALKCGSMAAVAMASKVGQVQRSGGAALQMSTTWRRSTVSAGAHSSGRASEEICFTQAALSTTARSRGRDCRVCSSGNASGQLGDDGGRSATRLHATVEKANDVEATQDKNIQMFGSSEASCDEGSLFFAVGSILENEVGISVEDYKRRAHFFTESDIFFRALKDRKN